MNRRKYLLSTLGLGAGIGIVSQYNSKPSIATNINLPDSHTVPHDIADRENPHLELDLNSFKINEINYHGKIQSIRLKLKQYIMTPKAQNAR